MENNKLSRSDNVVYRILESKWSYYYFALICLFLTPFFLYVTGSDPATGKPREGGTNFFIIVLCQFKSSFSFSFILFEIQKDRESLVRYYRFLGKIFIISCLTIISFSIDYYLSHLLNNNCWSGVSNEFSQKIIQFVYYSFMTFSTVGYGEINAIGWVPMSITAIQVLLSIALLVCVLGGFDNIVNIFGENNPINKYDDLVIKKPIRTRQKNKLFRQPPPPRTWRKS